MFERALTIGHVRGVAIRVHFTWLFIAAIVAWSFWSQFTVLRDFEPGPALAMAGVATLLFFASILVHELAHAMEAKRRGVGVKGITLFLFGGVTESRFDVRRPVDELALTAVGPLASFVLAAGFAVGATGAESADWAAGAQVLGTLGWLNLALGLFNLLPGAPLDGGRILRATVWWATRDRDRATRAAANAGRVLGFVLIGLGIAELVLLGAALGGLWLAVLGWFLLQAARAELEQSAINQALSGVTVRELLPRSAPTVDADEPVSDASSALWYRETDEIAVRDEVGLVGSLDVDAVRHVAPAARATTSVRQVMTPSDELTSIEAGAPATSLLDLVAESHGPLAVTDHDRVVALLDPRQVVTAVRRRAHLEDGAGSGRLAA